MNQQKMKCKSLFFFNSVSSFLSVQMPIKKVQCAKCSERFKDTKHRDRHVRDMHNSPVTIYIYTETGKGQCAWVYIKKKKKN
jgi:hypothetical protein